MRYAVYFTPGQDTPLTQAAEAWLGYSAFDGDSRVLPTSTVGATGGTFSASEIFAHTKQPRRYGFHATMKAPFRLGDGYTETDLQAALAAFCQQRIGFSLPLKIARLNEFFALVPAQHHIAVKQLANDAVAEFEPFRAKLTLEEIARRNPDRLNDRQLKYLQEWGYPYVFDEFYFHMTLTGRVPAPEATRMEKAISEMFQPLLKEPVSIDSLALFVEPEPGAPFHIRSVHPFGTQRKGNPQAKRNIA